MAATLVIGTFATTTTTIGTTQQSTAFAYSQQKKKGDDNNSRNGNTITALKCQNRGSASGFDTTVDQECENLICTHPGNNATCVQEGAAAATPVKLTCEQCFTKFLSSTQISLLLRAADVTSLEQLCATLPTITTALGLLDFLVFELGVSESAAIQLIQCLLDAGIVFPTDTESVRTLK